MPSRKDSSPASYSDVRFVMDMAVKKPGLQYVLKTPGAATNFKQRCNKFRNLMRDMAAEALAGMPGFRAETAYDPIVIRQVNEQRIPDRQGHILVFEYQALSGELIDPETGEAVEVPGITGILKEF